MTRSSYLYALGVLLAISGSAAANPPTVQTANGPQQAAPVEIVDANGNQITSLGSGGGTSTAVTPTLVSRSVASTVASTSTALVAANATRHIIRIQAPQASGVWLNLLGGTAAPNAVDCFWLSPGGTYESSDGNAITYYIGTAGLVIPAVEG